MLDSNFYSLPSLLSLTFLKHFAGIKLKMSVYFTKSLSSYEYQMYCSKDFQNNCTLFSNFFFGFVVTKNTVIPLCHKIYTYYVHRAAKCGGCVTPLHAVLPNIPFPRFISEWLLSDKASHAHPDGQTSERAWRS